jgi:iron complex outermembrane receptor protein
MVIEEVTVTATKRATNVQETPLAVTAYNQDSLDKNQVRTLQDMVSMVPALQIGNHGDSNALDVTLRGVGSTNRTELGDPAVAFHVNDVYSPRPQGAAVLMYDVERVEVQRGPQGTLSGRNATVGAVSIHTVKPNFEETSGNMALTAGNYDRQGMKAAYNHPVNDKFAIRIAGFTDRHDGYVDTLSNYVGLYPNLDANNLDEFQYSPRVDIKDYEAADQTSWRISTRWQISENARWDVTYEWYKDAGTGWVDEDPFLVNRGIKGVVVDSPGSIDMTNQAISSRLDIDFGAIDFSYILGIGNQKRSQVWDADLGRGTAFQEDRTEWSDYDFMSHELQLKNSDDARFRWVVGLYSSAEDNAIRFDIDQVDNAGSEGNWEPGGWSWIDGVDGGGASFRQPNRELKSQAIFAQATFDITDSTRFTGGVRYIDDEKSDVGGRSINCGPFIRSPRTGDSLGGHVPNNNDLYEDPNIQAGASDNGTNQGIGDEDCWVRQVNDTVATWDKTTWLARYEQDFGDQTMFYASVGTGFKSGIIQDAGLEAEPEFITNTELGLKTTLADGKLRINTAIYNMDYENLQVSRPLLTDVNGDGIPDGQGSLFTVNAAEATINGLETELNWIIGENGHFGLIATFLDATYDEFDRDEPNFGQDNPWNPPSDGALGEIGFVNLAGNQLIRAPEYEVTLSYEHLFVLTSGTLVPRLQVTFVDDVYLDEWNRTDITGPNGTTTDISVMRAYENVNFNLRYSPHKARWNVDLFVRNATDENIKNAIGGFLGPEGYSGYYEAPRTYGVTFAFDW